MWALSSGPCNSVEWRRRKQGRLGDEGGKEGRRREKRNPFLEFLPLFIYFLMGDGGVCTAYWMRASQVASTASLFPPGGFQGLNSDHRVGSQASLSTEPSHQPKINNRNLIYKCKQTQLRTMKIFARAGGWTGLGNCFQTSFPSATRTNQNA